MSSPPPRIAAARLRAIPSLAPVLALAAERRGIYLVGGAVRDLLLDRPVRDVDVTVEGELAELLGRLPGGEGAAGTRLVRHERFGTATLTAAAGVLDLAETRTERYARPGALPEVARADLSADLARRDFTVNALALDLALDPAPVIAVPGALADLEGGRLRVLHPGSFRDDPTRLLRLVRYAARLGFEPEPGTRELAREAATPALVWSAGGSRLGHELRLLAAEPSAGGALAHAHALGIDRAVDPAFGLGEPALLAGAQHLLPADGRAEALVWACALRGLAPERARILLERLHLPAVERELVLRALGEAPSLARILGEAECPSAILAAAGGRAPEVVALAGALGAQAAAREWLERLRHARLEIGGAELLAAGVPAGPEVGRRLRRALAAHVDGRAPDRESQLAAALGRGSLPE